MDLESDLLDVIGAARNGLCDTKAVIEREINTLCDEMNPASETELVSTSREEILKAAETLKEQLAVEKFDSRRTEIFTQLDTNIRLLEKMQRLLLKHDEDRERLIFHQKEVEKQLGDLTIQRYKHHVKLDRFLSRLLQTRLQQLVEDRDSVTKEWYFQEVMSEFGDHVTSPIDTQPVVEVTAQKTEGLPFPPEILRHIYSTADLETCVVLRQVNTEFYTIFQHSEGLFRRKLQQRNPWMCPGDSIFSWSACVLVFVARLKWSTTQDLNSIKVAPKAEKRKTVVAFELEHNQRLPDTFKSMQQTANPCRMTRCDHMHIYRNHGPHFVYDFKSLTARDGDHVTEITGEVDDTTVVEVLYGYEIVLPTDKMPEDGSCPEVHMHPNSTVVTLRDGEKLIMPRSKPEFEHGYFLHAEEILEVNNLQYAQTSREEDDVFWYKRQFVDVENKRVFDFPGESTAIMAASYDGLVWWKLGECLIPTFVDLDTPEEIYYSENQTITGLANRCDFLQFDKSRDSHHFAFDIFSAREFDMVDFSTGTVTHVTSPLGTKGGYQDLLFPGFVNGHFQVHLVSAETQELVRADIMSGRVRRV